MDAFGTLTPLAVFGPLDWLVVAGYFALMLAIGWWVSRPGQDAKAYFLAGRSLPTWALAVSIVATSLSAATFIGVPDEAYRGDIGYLIVLIGSFEAVIIVGLLFVPRLYRAGTVTIYGYLRPRFGEAAVIAVSCTFLVGRMLASGTRLFMAAIPLCRLLFRTTDPWNHRGQLVFAIALIGVMGTAYTVKGGIRAVVWTDAVQLLLVIGAAAITIGILLHRIPQPPGTIFRELFKAGKLNTLDTSFDLSRPYTIWASIFGAVFLMVANFGVDQDFAQRFMIARSPMRGAISVMTSQLIASAVVTLFLTVGLLLYVFYRRPDLMGGAIPAHIPKGGLDPAYPLFLMTELPSGLAGLAVVGFFAVAQGSMDSAINAMASSVVTDLYDPFLARRGRPIDWAGRSTRALKLAVACVGGLMVLFAIGCAAMYDPSSTLLSFALGVMSFAFAGMLGVFITALFTRRGNPRSVIASLIAGAAVIALLQDQTLAAWTNALFRHPVKLAWPWWMPIGTGVSFLVCFAGHPRPAPARGSDVSVGKGGGREVNA